MVVPEDEAAVMWASKFSEARGRSHEVRHFKPHLRPSDGIGYPAPHRAALA